MQDTYRCLCQVGWQRREPESELTLLPFLRASQLLVATPAARPLIAWLCGIDGSKRRRSGSSLWRCAFCSLPFARPSCAAPAATCGTRRQCSPSASTSSATSASRCATTPGRGSAPSATVPSAPTTSTASTSPEKKAEEEEGQRWRWRWNQRSFEAGAEAEEVKIYLRRTL